WGKKILQPPGADRGAAEPDHRKIRLGDLRARTACECERPRAENHRRPARASAAAAVPASALASHRAGRRARTVLLRRADRNAGPRRRGSLPRLAGAAPRRNAGRQPTRRRYAVTSALCRLFTLPAAFG